MAHTTIISSETHEELWIGLVEFVPNFGNKNFGTAKGGYVNVIAKAANEAIFVQNIHNAVKEFDITVTNIDDMEKVAKRHSNRKATKEVLEMIKKEKKLNSVTFGTFYTFDNTDIDE